MPPTGTCVLSDQTALERRTVVIHGDRSELHLADGQIVMHKEATTQAEPTEVAFGVGEVRGATLRPPGRDEPGWLHVSVVGGTPPPPGGLAATSDPYTLPLVGRSLGPARRLVKLVERHVQVRGLPPDRVGADVTRSSGVVVRSDMPADGSGAVGAQAGGARAGRARAGGAQVSEAGAPARPGSGSDGLVERLRELADLHEAGALTDAEFERAKAKVLG